MPISATRPGLAPVKTPASGDGGCLRAWTAIARLL